MHIIGLILFLSFVFFLAKATLETLWGGWLLIQIVFLSGLSMLLYLAAAVVQLFERPSRRKDSKIRSEVTAKRQPPMAGAIHFN